MNLTLIVTTPGPRQGHVIPVRKTPFVIGRDPHCQMRPASLQVSHQHCVLELREFKAFIRDLNSTNGTFVNRQPIAESTELRHSDRITVGPLEFEVAIQANTNQAVSDDEMAALMLTLDHENPTPRAQCAEADIVPAGDTRPVSPAVPTPRVETQSKGPYHGDTTAAATAILQIIRRRPRQK